MNRLKEIRKKSGASQKDLAYLLNVSEKTISRWENNETQIKPDKAQQLAIYFNVPVEYLLGYVDISKEWLDIFQQIGFPQKIMSPLELEALQKGLEIDIPQNTLSDDDIKKLPPEERKKYISDYIDDLSDALSNLADFASTTADLTADQISKINDTLIQALAKLNNIKNKNKD